MVKTGKPGNPGCPSFHQLAGGASVLEKNVMHTARARATSIARTYLSR
jgi:hypothetical protein